MQVTHRRYQLGVDPFRRSVTIEWRTQMLDNLGEISDKDFAEYFESVRRWGSQHLSH